MAGVARESLDWPEICNPLLEQRDSTNYEWARFCQSYAYGGSDGHADALLCSVEGRWHHALVCELFRLASDCTSVPCKTSVATVETLRNGLQRGSAPLPRGASDLTEVVLVKAAPVVANLLPNGKLSFRAFLSIYIMGMLCLNKQDSLQQRVYHLRPQPLGREGCKALLEEHYQHIFETLTPNGVAAKPRAKIWALLPKGPLGAADAEPGDRHHFKKLGNDHAWSRFVVRTPRKTPPEGDDGKIWLVLQEAWGWQNAWAAVRLAGQLDAFRLQGSARGEIADSPGGQLEGFLQRLSAERQSMLDGREQVEGEQRQLGYLRWRESQRTLTPISGNYRSAWRSALLRRAHAAGKTAVTTLFTLPSGEKHGVRCSAVLNWVDLPMSCEGAVRDIALERRLSVDSSLLNIPGRDDSCRVVLNRAMLLTILDATTLGVKDCHEWVGVPVVQHNASYAIRPQWLHADLTAISILERHVLPPLFHDITVAAEAVWDPSSPEPLQSRLAVATDLIAAFTWYLFSAAMYTRGSAAIAILAHHALYLWLVFPDKLADQRSSLARHRLQALRCLPNWRSDAMPDIEAASSHTVDQYVREAYWASFEGFTVNSTRSNCLLCLERELEVSAASVERAEGDTQQMGRVLKALRNRRAQGGKHFGDVLEQDEEVHT